ncbi:26s proteasome subunit p55, partial [Cystoisospora suis]
RRFRVFFSFLSFQYLQSYILYMLLAPFDSEVRQLAESVQTNEAKKLKEMPV